MEIRYSKHIETRITLRRIDYNEPKRIYENADERFIDAETGHMIAVAKGILSGKKRDLMVAYKLEDMDVKLLTIHPLKERQKENRVKSGMWRRI